MRAFVEQVGLKDDLRHMVAVFEFNPPSIIHRQDVMIRTNASEAEILLSIAAAWNQMASDALAKKHPAPVIR